MAVYKEKYRVESTRLTGWDYRSRGWYFVTLCAQNHACIFGEVVDGEVHRSRVGLIAESDLRSLAGHYDNVQVDAYVVMPNHVHAIVMIDGEHCFSPKAEDDTWREDGFGFHLTQGRFSCRHHTFLQVRSDPPLPRTGLEHRMAVSLP